MRILTTAVLVAMASANAHASSIVVIGDDGAVNGNAVDVVSSGGELAGSPSVLTIGGAQSPLPAVENAGTEADAVDIPPLPMVIRAGIEGEAFTRAISPDGAGTAQLENGQKTQTPAKPQDQHGTVEAKAPSDPVAPRAPVDPVAEPQSVHAAPIPAAEPEPQPVTPTATVD